MRDRNSRLGRCESLCELLRLALEKSDDGEVSAILRELLERSLDRRGTLEEARFQEREARRKES